MAEETFDQLYGKKGIDTPYEREILTYRPDLRYSKEDIIILVRPEVQQSIERARTFTISQNLYEYDELIAEVNQMLQDIEHRNSSETITKLKELLTDKAYQDLFLLEKQHSRYNQTGDYEIYTLLYSMRDSMQMRRDFLDTRFRTQFTNETDPSKIEEAELQAIDEWEQLEAQVIAAYKSLAHYEEDDNHTHPLENESLQPNMEHLTYDVVEKLEQRKRNREILHTSLADTSYIHRNRYFMFLGVVEKAKILVYNSHSLIDRGLRDFILSLQDLPNLSAPKSHLVLQFRKLREKHEGLKGRMMTLDDEKETFASEKQYMYQQLETKTIEPMKHWLYEQEEGYSPSLDLFSKYMVNSMSHTRTTYDESIADMLNFYKSEADFYEQQILLLKEKEEIRKFYRILEDLEEVEQIRGEWVDEYLKANGYTP